MNGSLIQKGGTLVGVTLPVAPTVDTEQYIDTRFCYSTNTEHERHRIANDEKTLVRFDPGHNGFLTRLVVSALDLTTRPERLAFLR